jgi:high frequency lysogenization protein
MELSRTQSQALALAGVLQATYLVDCVARSGQAEAAVFNATLHSLFTFEAEDAEAVYGGRQNVRLGLDILANLLGGQRRPEYQNALKYSVGVLHLQRQFAANAPMQKVIHDRLVHAEKKLEHFTQEVGEIATSIAGIYQDTISTLKYRIQVSGSMQQLQNPANADKIRALLLAALRSAHLYRQLGGSRWQLLLGRKKLLAATKLLMV